MQVIIYDPQQDNMNTMFHDEAPHHLMWRCLRSDFHAIGFDLHTPSTYTGALEDVSWVVFANLPDDFKPKRLRKRIKIYLRRYTRNATFYQRCIRAGLSDRLTAILYEPEVVAEFNYDRDIHKLFHVIFTWNRNLVQLGKPYSKIAYPQPNYISDVKFIPFERRKLICNFSTNRHSKHPLELYTARVDAIRFLEKNYSGYFDHYGRGWSKDYTSWRGPVIDKEHVMAKYKFNLCYENSDGPPGYITEKLFDALRAGCVPIYWGDPHISETVPSSAFIDKRDFDSNESLFRFVSNMGEQEWTNYFKAGQQFLRSDLYKLHTSHGFFEDLKTGLLGK